MASEVLDGKAHQEKVRNARLESLKHTPAWDELVAELNKQEEKYWTNHRKQMAMGKYPDALEMARDMGKLDGIRALLRAPERAASYLERHNSEETS